MNVAVTGGAGQLGVLVLTALLREPGVTSVRCVDRVKPRVASPKLTSIVADVRTANLVPSFEGCEAVVHLAALVTAYRSRAEMYGVNVEGSERVFRASASAGVRRWIYASSVAAYGVVPGHPVPLCEDAPRYRQTNFAYADTKWQVESLLDSLQPSFPHMKVTRLRPAIIVGPHFRNAFVRSLQRGFWPKVGSAPLPIVWEGDVARGFVLAVFSSSDGPFNLSAEGGGSFDELRRGGSLRVVELSRASLAVARAWLTLRGAVGRWPALDPAWLRDHRARLVPTSERARRELGWDPECPHAIDVLARLRVGDPLPSAASVPAPRPS